MSSRKILFLLIKNEIIGLSFSLKTEINFKTLYGLSKKHDLAHLVFDAAIKNDLIDKESELYQKASKVKLLAIYRYSQQNAEYKRIKDCFQNNAIQFVPLKGSIIRDYYPESWMRTSCDIDVLIHEEDLKKATEALLAIGFTTDGVRHYHDISFLKGSVHLELHFNICEMNKQLDILLEQAWDYVEQYDRYEYRETSSYFMFHHIAHMAYHFLTGGCGIRPVLDLWILKRKHQYNEEQLIELLNKCHLVSFYNSACHLSEVWFGEEEHNEATLQMEKHIIEGGAYGTSEKGAVTGVARHGGSKFKYKLSIAFPSYKDMCKMYPVLINHKILLPFCYIGRIFSKLFGRKGKQVMNRSKTINNASKEEAKKFAYLIKELELDY